MIRIEKKHQSKRRKLIRIGDKLKFNRVIQDSDLMRKRKLLRNGIYKLIQGN